MPRQLKIEDIRACKEFLKDPTAERPEILESLKVNEIRLLLQAAAESTMISDKPTSMQPLREMFTTINDRYPLPLNKHDESPTKCEETFGKGAPEQWKQVLDN